MYIRHCALALLGQGFSLLLSTYNFSPIQLGTVCNIECSTALVSHVRGSNNNSSSSSSSFKASVKCGRVKERKLNEPM